MQAIDEFLQKNIASAFWVIFLLVPLSTGILACGWLPHESFDPSVDRLIASHEAIIEQQERPDETVTIYDAWQNKRTGKVYTPADFALHRHEEKRRIAYIWFMYGLLGCVFFAFEGTLKGRKFISSFVLALIGNLAIVALVLVQ